MRIINNWCYYPIKCCCSTTKLFPQHAAHNSDVHLQISPRPDCLSLLACLEFLFPLPSTHVSRPSCLSQACLQPGVWPDLGYWHQNLCLSFFSSFCCLLQNWECVKLVLLFLLRCKFTNLYFEMLGKVWHGLSIPTEAELSGQVRWKYLT